MLKKAMAYFASMTAITIAAFSISFGGQVTAPVVYTFGKVEMMDTLPQTRAERAASVQAASTPAPLLYHGAQIETKPKVYLVFWGPTWDQNDPEAVYLQNFYNGMYGDADTWSGNMTQYCQGETMNASSCRAETSGTVRPTTAKPIATTAKPKTATKKATTSTAKPTTTTAKPTTTTEKKVTTTTAKPTTTTAKPTTTTAKPTTTTAKKVVINHFQKPSLTVLAGVWFDSSSIPAAPNQSNLAAEANKAATHFNQTTNDQNLNNQYVIASPTGVIPAGFASQRVPQYQWQYCAYHSWLTGSNGAVSYTNLPYIADATWACGQYYVNNTGSDDKQTNGYLDGVGIVEGHEYGETVTDPYPAYVQGGWWDAYGQENGDKCAWKSPGTPGGARNIVLSTGTFAVQGLYSNNGSGCTFAYTDPTHQSL